MLGNWWLVAVLMFFVDPPILYSQLSMCTQKHTQTRPTPHTHIYIYIYHGVVRFSFVYFIALLASRSPSGPCFDSHQILFCCCGFLLLMMHGWCFHKQGVTHFCASSSSSIVVFQGGFNGITTTKIWPLELELLLVWVACLLASRFQYWWQSCFLIVHTLCGALTGGTEKSSIKDKVRDTNNIKSWQRHRVLNTQLWSISLSSIKKIDTFYLTVIWKRNSVKEIQDIYIYI